MEIKQILQKYKIIPDPLKDQFFLNDDQIIKKIVGFANLNKNDVVLEVGAGLGNLTEVIAKNAGRVIAFEVDKKFKPFLNKLPHNVDVRIEDAWEYIQLHGKWKKRKEYNKVVSNLPYSFVEKFLHNLTFLEYDKVILLVPIKFVNKIEINPVFGSFFKVKTLLEVHKEKFIPVPRTNSMVIELIKLPDPIENKNLALFLRQYIYQHEDQLAKNSLREGLIKYAKLIDNKKMTKNEAKNIIFESKINKELLDKDINGSEIYYQVTQNFK
ncbi:MAG: rRNA adenine N-6-methyltransferase family protein [Patescibacteria group bacterium]